MKLLITLLVFSSLFASTSFAAVYRFKCTSTSGSGNYVDIKYNDSPKKIILLEICFYKSLYHPTEVSRFNIADGNATYLIQDFKVRKFKSGKRFEFVMTSKESAKVYIDSDDADLTCEDMLKDAPTNDPIF